MAQASTLVPLQFIIVPELAKSLDIARLLTRACIYLKINKMKLLMKIVKLLLNEIDILGKRKETRASVGVI